MTQTIEEKSKAFVLGAPHRRGRLRLAISPRMKSF